MSQVQDDFVVCDQCGGAIPAAANRIGGVNFSVVMGGTGSTTEGKDFCCTAHAVAYIEAQTSVATPSPLYSPPPAP